MNRHIPWRSPSRKRPRFRSDETEPELAQIARAVLRKTAQLADEPEFRGFGLTHKLQEFIGSYLEERRENGLPVGYEELYQIIHDNVPPEFTDDLMARLQRMINRLTIEQNGPKAALAALAQDLIDGDSMPWDQHPLVQTFLDRISRHLLDTGPPLLRPWPRTGHSVEDSALLVRLHCEERPVLLPDAFNCDEFASAIARVSVSGGTCSLAGSRRGTAPCAGVQSKHGAAPAEYRQQISEERFTVYCIIQELYDLHPEQGSSELRDLYDRLARHAIMTVAAEICTERCDAAQVDLGWWSDPVMSEMRELCLSCARSIIETGALPQ